MTELFDYTMTAARDIVKNVFAVVGMNEKKALIGKFSSDEDYVLKMEYGFFIKDEGDIVSFKPEQDLGYKRGYKADDMEFPAVLINEADFDDFMAMLIEKRVREVIANEVCSIQATDLSGMSVFCSASIGNICMN